MKWSELKLTDAERRMLAGYAITEPEAVVALVRGARELAERVLSKTTVERLLERFPTSAVDTEQTFALGAMLAPPAEIAPVRADFEKLRDQLVERLHQAPSPAVRERIERDLQKLYSNG